MQKGVYRSGGGGSAASISCIYFEAPKVFELPESEPHGLAYAKCRPSEKERDALPLPLDAVTDGCGCECECGCGYGYGYECG